MSRIAYVNGRYLPHHAAAVHIEDRGYQFSDGVYEVCEVRNGHMVDTTRHLTRLARSLRELRIAQPMNDAALRVVLREVIARNHVRHGLVYMQVTRGVARRDHAFPDASTPPALVVTAKSTRPETSDALAAKGVAVITLPDNRWERVDIKTVGLLPNVMAKQAAKEAGAREAWFVDREGYVTEGSSTNAWIITKDGEIVTRPAESGILRGVTRTTLLELAKEEKLKVVERPFTVNEVKAAAEAFITAASTVVMPVVKIDGDSIGNGTPGPIAKRLRERFHDIAELS